MATLVGMGFTEQQAKDALDGCSGNLQRAVLRHGEPVKRRPPKKHEALPGDWECSWVFQKDLFVQPGLGTH